MIPSAEIDQALLSFCNEDWQKVAKIIGNTFKAFEARGLSINVSVTDAVDARMEVLVSSGQLEAQGNIRKWGYSEVRLPDGGKLRSR